MSTVLISAIILHKCQNPFHHHLRICVSAQTLSGSRVNGIIVTSTLSLL